MESLVLCLKKSAVTKNPFLTIEICSEITDFVSKTSTEERHLLVEQLNQNDLLSVLNEAITSNVRTLLEIMKLLCTISENPTFGCWEGSWPIMKNISRALIFITESRDLAQNQVEFVELVFMAEVIFKRFRGNLVSNKAASHVSNIQTLKQLSSICSSILKKDSICKACKISIIPLFVVILSIIPQMDVEKVFVHSILDTFYLIYEVIVDDLMTRRQELVIFLILKISIQIIRIPIIDNYDFEKIIQLLGHNFKTIFWNFLFEKTAQLILADFLITSFYSILWTIKVENQSRLLHTISVSFLRNAGMQRLLIFSNDIQCGALLKLKIKLLIGIIVVSVIENHFPTETESIIVENLLRGNIEKFANITDLECDELTNCIISFIYIFYVTTIFAKKRSSTGIYTIFQKICLILKSNYKRMTSNLFYMCMTVCQIYCEEHQSRRKDKLVITCMKEFFKTTLQEIPWEASICPPYKCLMWLKQFNEQLFHKCLSSYLDQHLNVDSDESLFKLISPSQIIHLAFSNSYNQIISTTRILANLKLTGDDIKCMLDLLKLNKSLKEIHLLGIIYVIRNNVLDINDSKIIFNFCFELINNEPMCYSRLGVELKTLFAEIVSTAVSLNRQLLHVNIYSS